MYSTPGIVDVLQLLQHPRVAVIPPPPPLYAIVSCGVVQGNRLEIDIRIRHEATQLVAVKLMLVPITLPVASLTKNL